MDESPEVRAAIETLRQEKLKRQKMRKKKQVDNSGRPVHKQDWNCSRTRKIERLSLEKGASRTRDNCTPPSSRQTLAAARPDKRVGIKRSPFVHKESLHPQGTGRRHEEGPTATPQQHHQLKARQRPTQKQTTVIDPKPVGAPQYEQKPRSAHQTQRHQQQRQPKRSLHADSAAEGSDDNAEYFAGPGISMHRMQSSPSVGKSETDYRYWRRQSQQRDKELRTMRTKHEEVLQENSALRERILLLSRLLQQQLEDYAAHRENIIRGLPQPPPPPADDADTGGAGDAIGEMYEQQALVAMLRQQRQYANAQLLQQQRRLAFASQVTSAQQEAHHETSAILREMAMMLESTAYARLRQQQQQQRQREVADHGKTRRKKEDVDREAAQDHGRDELHQRTLTLQQACAQIIAREGQLVQQRAEGAFSEDDGGRGGTVPGTDFRARGFALQLDTGSADGMISMHQMHGIATSAAALHALDVETAAFAQACAALIGVLAVAEADLTCPLSAVAAGAAEPTGAALMLPAVQAGLTHATALLGRMGELGVRLPAAPALFRGPGAGAGAVMGTRVAVQLSQPVGDAGTDTGLHQDCGRDGGAQIVAMPTAAQLQQYQKAGKKGAAALAQRLQAAEQGWQCERSALQIQLNALRRGR